MSGGKTAMAEDVLFGRAVRRIHAVGVGGMGLGPLAIYLAQSGFEVTGEDDALSGEMRAQLERGGVTLAPLPEHCDLLVYSSAIAVAHPAQAAAAARGVPAVRRGELLAEAVRGKKLVAVCGSHGKTTTTAMLVTALRALDFPTGYVLGGLFGDDTAPAAASESDWVVAEIDESDGTIARFTPEITVAVNLDWDHPDFYRSAAEIEATFAALFRRTRGTVIVNAAWAGVVREDKVATFGGGEGDFRGAIAAEAGEGMTLRLGGRFATAQAEVRARGEFNALNATAALAAAQAMGTEIAGGALARYPGVRRRQTVLSRAGGVTVIEDYAHHPAEIRALLGSLRARIAGMGGRLVVVFQPHRFSRTAQFKAEFAAALELADAVHLLEVYPAGEAPVAGGTTAEIAAGLRARDAKRTVHHAEGDAGWKARLTEEVRGGDWVVFVGAGDIERKAREWLASREPAASGGAADWDELAAELRRAVSADATVRREEPLGPKTTLRVGGAARVYVEPATVEDLRAVVRIAAARDVRWLMLGRGSNLVVPDEGVDAVVVALAKPAWAGFEPRGEGRVWVGAGLRLKNLCGLAAKAGLGGFEFLEGIPGNVGGALRMNAGAMGGWMFDVVEELQLLTRAGEVRTLRRDDVTVGYRHCTDLDEAIALGAVLRPAAAVEAETVSRQMDVYRRKRQESQPREPSAGCIFKNPPGTSAGRLIDESGLKGARVGDAEVSTVHANFIVNRGGATGRDVLELVRRIRARVRETKGIELEPEAILYGREWRDVL